MIIGTNAYAPGLTVRWVHHGAGFLSIRARNSVGAVIAGDASSGYAVMCRFPDRTIIDEPYTRRCDAKRAAEVLVGQWWREKCEREHEARAKGLTAVRTVTLRPPVQNRNPYDAVGCGAEVALGAMYAMTRGEQWIPRDVLRAAVRAAAAHCPSVRGPFWFVSTRSGE